MIGLGCGCAAKYKLWCKIPEVNILQAQHRCIFCTIICPFSPSGKIQLPLAIETILVVKSLDTRTHEQARRQLSPVRAPASTAGGKVDLQNRVEPHSLLSDTPTVFAAGHGSMLVERIASALGGDTERGSLATARIPSATRDAGQSMGQNP